MPDHAKVYKMLGIDVITEAQFIQIMEMPKADRDAELANLQVSQSIRDSLRSQGLIA